MQPTKASTRGDISYSRLLRKRKLQPTILKALTRDEDATNVIAQRWNQQSLVLPPAIGTSVDAAIVCRNAGARRSRWCDGEAMSGNNDDGASWKATHGVVALRVVLTSGKVDV